MTTVPTRHQLCTPGTCDYPVQIGVDRWRPCGDRRTDSIHLDAATRKYAHEFVEHTHVAACDAGFWRLMGCTPELLNDGNYYCLMIHAGTHRFANARLAPILSDPTAESSWLAMRDVLAEAERRGLEFEINAAGTLREVRVWRVGSPISTASAEFVFLDDLPRALALALAEAVKA